jgi:hypothetical protein
MIRYNLKIKDTLNCIRQEAALQDIDILVEPIHDDTEGTHHAAFVQNGETDRFGILCTHLEDTDPDILHYMMFNPKMYDYGTMEGFDKKQCFEAFSDDILKHCSRAEFIEFILKEETY